VYDNDVSHGVRNILTIIFADRFEGSIFVYDLNSNMSIVDTLKAPSSTIPSSQFNIYSSNINFGVSISIDEVSDDIIVGATGYGI